MKVSDVTTFTYVGEVVKHPNPEVKAALKMVWDKSLDRKFLSNPAGRVYIIAVDDVIYKIGGSESGDGIRGTWGSYCGGNTGRPSDRTYGINVLIQEQIALGKKVKVYAILSECVEAKVSGLTKKTEKTEMINLSYKRTERNCLNDYIAVEKEYPEWNFKEANKAWPQYIQEGAAKLRNS